MSKASSVVVIGAGGHARVLLDALRLLDIAVTGVTDADRSRKAQRCGDAEILGDDSRLKDFPPATTVLVNGIGSTDVVEGRRDVFERLRAQGYAFLQVIHPSAIVARDADLAEGVQLLAGAIVQPGAQIGMNSIVNTGAQVDHDCRLGRHVHVAPGATLSGGVQVGDSTLIGTGAVVIQGVSIGSRCLVAAGAVIVRDVADGSRVGGVPAGPIER